MNPSSDSTQRQPGRRRWPWITLAVVIVLLAGLRWALQSDWAFELLRNQVEQRGSNALQAELRIDRMHGDLLSDITVEGLSLEGGNGDEPMVAIERLAVNYSLWSLISGPVILHQMELRGLQADLSQDADSSWNVLPDRLDAADEDTAVEGEPDAGVPGGLPALQVQRLQLHVNAISVTSPILLPDGPLQVCDLELTSEFALEPDGYRLNLQHLAFMLHEGRLPEPLDIRASAEGDTRTFTLHQLVVNGGASLLETGGHYRTDEESFNLDLLLNPLASQTVRPFLDTWPLEQDLELELQADGSLEAFQAGLQMRADGLESLNIEAGFSTSPELGLSHLSVELQELYMEELLGDPDLPQLTSLDLQLDGHMPLDDVQSSQLSGQLRAEGLQAYPWQTDRLDIHIDLDGKDLDTRLQLNRHEQSLTVQGRVQDLWGDHPVWSLDYRIPEFTAETWMAEGAPDAGFSSQGSAEGEGGDFNRHPAGIQLQFDDVFHEDLQLEQLEIDAQLRDGSVQVASRINHRQSRIRADGTYQWGDLPSYRFDIQTRDLNLADWHGLQELPTRLNLDLQGEGTGLDPSTMSMTAGLSLTGSHIDGQTIDTLESRISLSDAVLQVRETRLVSALAEGRFDMRYNLERFEDPDNRLDFELAILDTEPFAEPAGLDRLDIRGDIQGTLAPGADGEPVFDGSLAFTDVAIDTLTAGTIDGVLTSQISARPDFDADLEVRRIRLGDRSVESVQLLGQGAFSDEDALDGQMELSVQVDPQSGLQHAGRFHYRPDSLDLHTESLALFNPVGSLELQEPFNLRYAGQMVHLEPVRLRSDEEAELAFALNQDSAGHYSGFLDGRGIQLALLQESFMQQAEVEGLMEADIRFDYREQDLELSSAVAVRQLAYRQMDLDSLKSTVRIADGQLHSDLTATHNGHPVLTSEWDLPFTLQEPADRTEDFFDHPVTGHLTLHPVELDRHQQLLSGLGFGGMQGSLGLHTELSGTAGSPELEGDVTLTQGSFSGVPIDSAGMSWNYVHEDDELRLSTYADSQDQRALDGEGRIPFYLDLESFQVSGPREGDTVSLQIDATEFRLAALDDFLPEGQLDGLEGTLDARLELEGPMDELRPDGNIAISGGRLSIIPAGIDLQRIHLDASISPDRLALRNLSLVSNGTLTLSGDVALDGHQPGAIDLHLRGRNIRLMDTRDYQVMVTLNSRIGGTAGQPEVSGNLSLDRGHLFLDNFGERTVEQVDLEEMDQDAGVLQEDPQELAAVETPDDTPELFDRMAMELNLGLDRRFSIRNRRDPELNLGVQGDLDLVKDPGGSLQIFGELDIPTGYANTLLNRRFTIDSGQIVFTGPPANPDLNIRTEFSPRQRTQDIRIWYVISGRADNPEFSYESEPEMELQDIISYTVFGQPFHSLGGWEQSVAGRWDGNIASELALDLLLDRVEAFAAGRFGIDVIEIDNTRRSGGGTSITAGKYLTDRLFFSLVQELGGRDASRQVKIEYMLGRDLELVLTGSDDHRSGVDVLWRYDY